MNPLVFPFNTWVQAGGAPPTFSEGMRSFLSAHPLYCSVSGVGCKGGVAGMGSQFLIHARDSMDTARVSGKDEIHAKIIYPTAGSDSSKKSVSPPSSSSSSSPPDEKGKEEEGVAVAVESAELKQEVEGLEEPVIIRDCGDGTYEAFYNAKRWLDYLLILQRFSLLSFHPFHLLFFP